MLKMIFVFFVIVAVLPNFNCKPLTSYQKFVKAKCAIPLPILKTKYPEIENDISFFDKFQACENPDEYLQELCQNIFTILWDISTCNQNFITKGILNFDSSNLSTGEFEDTCNAFKNQKFSKRINEYPIYQFLKVKSACDFFCSVNMELCDILLWVYTVHDVLLGQQVTLENKTSSNTPNNELAHVSSVTPTITQLATSEVTDFSKEIILKADSAEHKHPNESRNLSTEKPLKSNSVNLTTDLGMTKQIVTSVSPSVTSVSPSVTSVSPSVTSVSASVTSVSASVTSAGLLVTHTSSQVVNNVTLTPSVKNDVSKNHIETKIKEIQPNASSKGNEQNTKSVSKSITYKTPSSVKEDVQSLPTESGKNLFNDASFTEIDEFEDENADFSNAEMEINDNNEEDNKLSSSMEKKTVSRNSAKSSSSTHSIAESGSKAQELKANNEDSTGAVQSTKPEEKPNKSLPPENIPFDSNDKVSKESTPDEKYITGDYSLPEDGGGKPKSNIPASKFTESNVLSKNQNMIPEVEDPQFFFYFLCTVLLVATCYVLYHNKQKIIALIVEGCHERRRRPLGVNYRKLETK